MRFLEASCKINKSQQADFRADFRPNADDEYESVAAAIPATTSRRVNRFTSVSSDIHELFDNLGYLRVIGSDGAAL